MSDLTRILSAIEQGDGQAAEELLPLVYEELCKFAADKLADEKSGQTLQASAQPRLTPSRRRRPTLAQVLTLASRPSPKHKGREKCHIDY